MVKKRTVSAPNPHAPSTHEGGGRQRGLPAGSKGGEALRIDRPRPSATLVAALCLALGLAAVAIYAQIHRYGFIEYDDNTYVYDNAMVKKGLTLPGVEWAFTTFCGANWHPLTWLSHMLDCQLFGLNAGAHHLVNLAFHLAGTLVLFIAFVRMTRRPWRSALVAGIFAVHPLHVESVAWIAERKDVLSTFLGALTLLFYVRYTQTHMVARYVLVVFVFALGLMAKSMLVTLPFVLLLLDIWPLGRLQWPPAWKSLKPLLREKILLFAMVAAVSTLTFVAQHRGGAVSGLARLPFRDRVATAAIACLAYIGKAFWPLKLGVLYPYQAHAALNVFGAFVVLLAVTIAAFAWAGKRPYFLVGWLWYLGMLVPVSGLVQVGAQSMADRYTYLPLVGLSLAVVWLVADLVENQLRLRRVAAVIACMALVLLGARAYRQASYWGSSLSLFERTLAVTDKNYLVHKSLAVVLDHEGRRDEAVARYEAALAINPRCADAHNGLGLILDREGKSDEAIAHYRQALASQDDFAEAHNNLGAALDRAGRRDEAMAHYQRALALRPDLAGAHKNLGVMYASEGKRDEAMAHYRQALAIDPDYAEVHNNLGVILANNGRNDEAMSHYRRALACRPDYAQAHANLGHELLRSGKLDESYSHLKSALEAEPALFDAHADLGTLLAARGEFDESARHLEESLRMAPDQPDVHSNLGFVLTRLGRVEEAIAHCTEALRLKPDSVDPHYNLGMALAATGMRTEAAAEFSKVLALNPGHAAARTELAKLQGPE